MSSSNTLYGGIFGAFVVSCGAMVLLPHTQIGRLNPAAADWDGSTVSVPSSYPHETQKIGRITYVANGCFYCHTQQVRDPQYGPDVERGWGMRRTVARDYIFEGVPLLGSTRIGPDFSNYGTPEWRNEPQDDPKKPVKRDEAWIYRHMYEPSTIVSDSKCPPHRFLFTREEVAGSPSPDAVKVEGRYEWVPTPAMRELAEYIVGQARNGAVPEIKAKAQEEKK